MVRQIDPIYVRGKRREQVSISETMMQRGTGKEINRRDAIVFDFIPVILGYEFSTEDVLSRQLFREAPVSGPFMLMQNAYTELGKLHLARGQLVSALESYKFALKNQTDFISGIAMFQGHALLSPDEISHLGLGSLLEEMLIQEVGKKGKKVDLESYSAWLEEIRKLFNLCRELESEEYHANPYIMGKGNYGALNYSGEDVRVYNLDNRGWEPISREKFTPEYRECLSQLIDVSLRVGRVAKALEFARLLGEEDITKKARALQVEEQLDLVWLNRYVERNYPESSVG